MATSKRTLPLLSIVVPSFNQAEFLAEALDSIFRQNYPCLEVVVMDGGSTDGSMAIIESYADRLTYWQSQPDGGQSAAINAGVERCSGDLVAWLNSDDFYWGDALWTVARAYQAHPGHGLYVGNGFRYNQSEGRYTPFIPRHVAFNRAALRHGLDYILQPSTFFLREAWRTVGGLDTELQFCMDWDILLRIARAHSAVVVNEFLSASREYETTKTRSGGLKRVHEILRMVQTHTGQELTPGSLFYLVGSLHEWTASIPLGEPNLHLGRTLAALENHFSVSFGGGHWTPECSDAGDAVYVPVPEADDPLPPAPADDLLPRISLIVPCRGYNAYLEDTLQSFFAQQYLPLEVLISDASHASQPPVGIEKYRGQVSYGRSPTCRNLAGTVNEGLARASGEVLGWIKPGDLLTVGALRAVGQAFADDPDLDLVYANAAYVDCDGQPCLADQGTLRSGLLYGTFGPPPANEVEFAHTYAVPQPTVFFRRRLLERLGPLDESYHVLHDYELFVRYARAGKVKKIERTQALCRLVDGEDASRWNARLVELYRHNRAAWPAPVSRHYLRQLRAFLRGYALRKLQGRSRPARWLRLALAGLAAVTRLVNPERWGGSNLRVPPRAARLLVPPPRFVTAPIPQACRQEPSSAGSGAGLRLAGRSDAYRSLVCLPRVPTHPGRCGYEEREYQFLRRLMGLSTVQMFTHRSGREPLPGHRTAPAHALHTPATLTLFHPHLVSLADMRLRFRTRVLIGLREQQLPVPGPNCPVQVTQEFSHVRTFARIAVQEALERDKPDFLFVMPQTNPVALTLATQQERTRLVLLVHRIEKDALSWLARTRRGLASWASSLEASRAERFERDNLARFDGVIVPGAEERERLIQEYGYPAERILIVPSGVDVAHWAETPRARAERTVVFHGSFQDERIRVAARRLLESIWPQVRRAHPGAELWLLNTDTRCALPGAKGRAGVRVFHNVNDVRPQLGQAAGVCLPLPAGGGCEGAILETLASAVPLVCTAAAIDAVPAVRDGVHCLVGQTDTDLAAAIGRLLDDQALGERLGRCGRELAGVHSWEKCLAPLSSWLHYLASLPHLHQSSDRQQLRAA